MLEPIEARRAEARAVAWSFATFFFLLSAYYIVRPVRDAMAIEAGIQNMQWLFSGTFIAMLLAAPVFGWAAGRFPRRRLVPGLLIFFVLDLALFHALFALGVAPAWIAGAFFIWVSVFNLFSVSVFWSFMADLHDTAQAKRSFGLISAGGSAGAIAGPVLTSLLATRLETANLLLLSAALLVLATATLIRLLNQAQVEAVAPRRDEHATRAESELGATSRGAWQGFVLIAASPLLRALCVYTLLYTALSTFLYFEQARIVQDAVAGASRRTQLFAQIDLATNLLTLTVQLFGTRRFMARFGLAAALAAVPALTLAGFLLLAFVPSLLVLVTFQVLRRAGDFALGRPAREALFTLTNRDTRYKAKSVIDTVVYRAGDAGSSWLVALLQAAASTIVLAWAAPVLAALWVLSARILTTVAARLKASHDAAR